MRRARVIDLMALLLLGTGCGGSQTPTTTSEGAAQKSQLTAEECEASGGTVVGDIGDGAIHRPEYLCPSGKRPSGSIRAPEGGPIAIEGSVCCPS
jgi:hypothetical protein